MFRNFSKQLCVAAVILVVPLSGKAITPTLEEFKKDIEVAQANATGQARYDICKEAFASKNYELLRLCFNAGFLGGYRDLLKEEKDPLVRALAVLAILSGSSAVWLDDPATMDYNTQHEALARLCIPILQEYLPASELKKDRFFLPADRLVIAKTFEKRLRSLGIITDVSRLKISE